MILSLAIDASTYVGTVAVLRDEHVVVAMETPMRGAEQERLMPLVDRALKSASVDVRALQRVICGDGPGSFTSLRIAASIAKGLAAGGGIPLFVVPSLALVATETSADTGTMLACVMDAMREECYFALATTTSGGAVTSLDYRGVIRRGDAAELAAAHGARLVDASETRPHAKGVAQAQGLIFPVDHASWEPTYGRLAEAQVKWEAAHGRSLDLTANG